MIESTWQEEPESRPTFTDIVQFFHDQNIKDTLVDEVENITVGTEKNNGYLDLSNSQT